MSIVKNPAEERLLDAALAEALGREPQVSRPPRPRRLLAAALLLLGVGVVAATVWSREPARGSSPAQEPQHAAPLPPEVFAEGNSEVAALPVGTANLVAQLSGPADLRALTRLRALRRLVVLPAQSAPPSLPAHSWLAATGDPNALAPLAALAALEELQLPFEFEVAPEHLAALRGLRALRSLAFGNTVCSAAHSDAIAVLPALRELRLTIAVVDAPFFTALARAPRPVASLVLEACPGLDDAAWAAIAELRSLHRLVVTNQNSEGSTSVAGQTRMLATLGEAAFTALAALPALRELGLDESAFDDRWLPRLPVALQVLDLGDRPMGSLAADALRRLADLRELTFGCGLDAAAAVDLLSVLRLRRLDYRGMLDGSLVHAVGAQPELLEFAAKLRGPIDLGPLTAAPRLATLELRGVLIDHKAEHQPSLAELAPLAKSRSLELLRLVDLAIDGAAVGELLDRRVTIAVVKTTR